jgi:hypothetical protein
MAGSCGHDNKSSISVPGGEFLDQLSDCQLLKKERNIALVINTRIGLYMTINVLVMYISLKV